MISSKWSRFWLQEIYYCSAFEARSIVGQFDTGQFDTGQFDTGQFDTTYKNGQFDTADNLTPRTILHHIQKKMKTYLGIYVTQLSSEICY